MSISDATVIEGDAASRVALFTVTRTGGSAAFEIECKTADGTATVGDDYYGKWEKLSFGIGENTKTLTISVKGDHLVEPDETFYVNLFGATNGAKIGDGQGVGTIVDDDSYVVPVDPGRPFPGNPDPDPGPRGPIFGVISEATAAAEDFAGVDTVSYADQQGPSGVIANLASPARNTGARTTSVQTRRAGAGPRGVVTVSGFVGISRSASAARRTLIRPASRRNRSGVVRESRNSARMSCTRG